MKRRTVRERYFMLEAPPELPSPLRSAAVEHKQRKKILRPISERLGSGRRNRRRLGKRRQLPLQAIETRALLCRTAANPKNRYRGGAPADRWPDKLRSFH